MAGFASSRCPLTLWQASDKGFKCNPLRKRRLSSLERVIWYSSWHNTQCCDNDQLCTHLLSVFSMQSVLVFHYNLPLLFQAPRPNRPQSLGRDKVQGIKTSLWSWAIKPVGMGQKGLKVSGSQLLQLGTRKVVNTQAKQSMNLCFRSGRVMQTTCRQDKWSDLVNNELMIDYIDSLWWKMLDEYKLVLSND